MDTPILIVFSGLPGTGKTTIAKAIAQRTGSVYLRIDTIEQALRNAGVLAGDVGSSGYQVANDVALGNLQIGNSVVVDCVNPVVESRHAWAAVATKAAVRLLDVQVVCSDKGEHRRRVETRQADVPGLVPPSWLSVLEHEYEPWLEAPFTLDTAELSPFAAVAALLEHITRSAAPRG